MQTCTITAVTLSGYTPEQVGLISQQITQAAAAVPQLTQPRATKLAQSSLPSPSGNNVQPQPQGQQRKIAKRTRRTKSQMQQQPTQQ